MPKESDSYAENATLSGHVPAEGEPDDILSTIVRACATTLEFSDA